MIPTLCLFFATAKPLEPMHLSPLHRTFLPSLFQAFSVRIDFAGRPSGVKSKKTVLAAFLQRPTDSLWRLQNFCKRQNGENGICRTSANVKMGKMAFAELLQTSKRRKWHLQNFCKRQNGENGACRSSASTEMLCALCVRPARFAISLTQ